MPLEFEPLHRLILNKLILKPANLLVIEGRETAEEYSSDWLEEATAAK